MIKFKRGMNLPITGAPEHVIVSGGSVGRVALLGSDYHGLKPTMKVKVGDRVAQGQALFEDKRNPGVNFVSPLSGVVESINRGDRRVFKSVVIAAEPSSASHESSSVGNKVQFPILSEADLLSASRDLVVERLAESGLWTALRTRPFSNIPFKGAEPSALFINAMDTNPLAVDAHVILNGKLPNRGDKANLLKHDFVFGQRVLQKLTSGPVFVSASPKADIPVSAGVQLKRFEGPHPSGLVGTHIHALHPVNDKKVVWHIGYQDVIAVGALFRTGFVDFTRFIALGGPQVKEPKILITVVGADLEQLTAGRLLSGENRIISGSILSGHQANGLQAFLGRYHQQVSVLREGRERGFMEYLAVGAKKHSALPVFLSKWMGERPLPLTTTTNGSERGMVPVGAYEKVMPLDILPTQLLRSLIVGDTETAQALGCLELDEEDLALCTYVCPCKYEYGPILRSNLIEIEKDG